jgi:hypothetical protein
VAAVASDVAASDVAAPPLHKLECAAVAAATHITYPPHELLLLMVGLLFALCCMPPCRCWSPSLAPTWVLLHPMMCAEPICLLATVPRELHFTWI